MLPDFELPSPSWNYPEENGDNPFDLMSEACFFLSVNSSISLASSDTEFFTNPYINPLIPVPCGRYVLSVYHRVMLIHKGNIIKTIPENEELKKRINPRFGTNKVKCEYGYTTGGYCVFESKPDAQETRACDLLSFFITKEEALDFTLKESEKNSHSCFLITQVMDSVSMY